MGDGGRQGGFNNVLGEEVLDSVMKPTKKGVAQVVDRLLQTTELRGGMGRKNQRERVMQCGSAPGLAVVPSGVPDLDGTNLGKNGKKNKG